MSTSAPTGKTVAQEALRTHGDSVLAQRRHHQASRVGVSSGVDLLVFIKGISENDASTRALIFEGLEALGIPKASVRVMRAKEEVQIAWQASRFVT